MLRWVVVGGLFWQKVAAVWRRRSIQMILNGVSVPLWEPATEGRWACMHACFEGGSADDYLVINYDFDCVTTMTHGCHLSWYSLYSMHQVFNKYNT
jgi:hypothetical protein